MLPLPTASKVFLQSSTMDMNRRCRKLASDILSAFQPVSYPVQEGGNHATHSVGFSKPAHGYSKRSPTKRETSHRRGIKSSSCSVDTRSRLDSKDGGLL